jgi:glycerol dehydrogenase-like iron-containing ADH family enzyme
MFGNRKLESELTAELKSRMVNSQLIGTRLQADSFGNRHKQALASQSQAVKQGLELTRLEAAVRRQQNENTAMKHRLQDLNLKDKEIEEMEKMVQLVRKEREKVLEERRQKKAELQQQLRDRREELCRRKHANLREIFE